MFALVAWLLVPLFAADLKATTPPPLNAGCDDADLGSLVTVATAAHDKTSGRVRSALDAIVAIAGAGDRAELCKQIGTHFSWARASRMLLTGYYTPTVRGSMARDVIYRYPLYRRPAGALAKKTTAEVLGGALAGHELVWLADPYDALAVAVEGAAAIILPDGGQIAVGTDGHNNQPYQNVTKLLIADHKLSQGAAPPATRPGNPKARAYFEAHPEELNRYWAKNPHFVFFKTLATAGTGTFGALVPLRSVAVDTNVIPLGSLLWIYSKKPVIRDGRIIGWTPFARLALAADTGAGIVGNRLDLYYGADADAQVGAAATAVDAEVYVLTGR